MGVVFEGVGLQDEILVCHLDGVFEEAEVLVGIIPPNLAYQDIGRIYNFTPVVVISDVLPHVELHFIGSQHNGFIDKFDFAIYFGDPGRAVVSDLVAIQMEGIRLNDMDMTEHIHPVAVAV
jgi:hypothetical protein